jgi:hypothetical protein
MKDSAAGRVVGALIAPGETFRSIAARPGWVAPMLVLVLFGTVAGYLVTQRIDLAPLMRHQNEVSGGQLSPDQLEQRIEVMQKVQPYLALFQGLIVMPAFLLLAALLLWLGFRLLGSEIDWRASLATSLHALLPLGVLSLLSIPVILNHGSLTPEEARNGTLVASNLAVLAPESLGKVARALLASVDLFSIWAIVLLVLGLHIVAKVSRAAAVAVVLALWLLAVALKVGFVALAPG